MRGPRCGIRNADHSKFKSPWPPPSGGSHRADSYPPSFRSFRLQAKSAREDRLSVASAFRRKSAPDFRLKPEATTEAAALRTADPAPRTPDPAPRTADRGPAMLGTTNTPRRSCVSYSSTVRKRSRTGRWRAAAGFPDTARGGTKRHQAGTNGVKTRSNGPFAQFLARSAQWRAACSEQKS